MIVKDNVKKNFIHLRNDLKLFYERTKIRRKKIRKINALNFLFAILRKLEFSIDAFSACNIVKFRKFDVSVTRIYIKKHFFILRPMHNDTNKNIHTLTVV